jgi:hypothetical protein
MRSDHRGGDRTHAAGQALSGNEDVRLDAQGLDPPTAGRCGPICLNLVGDVESTVFAAERLSRGEIALRRHREAIGCRHGLQEDRRHIASGQLCADGVEIGERHLRELIGEVGQEVGRPGILAGSARQPRAAVVAAARAELAK